MKRLIRLWYSDMWGHDKYQFNARFCYFTSLLRLRYNIKITPEHPDILIFSCFGNSHKKIKAPVKIFFCGENSNPPGVLRKIIPDYNFCDVSLTHYPHSPNNYYFPLWILFVNWFRESMPHQIPSNPTFLIEPDELISTRDTFNRCKARFCAFINNNPVGDRISLFNSLSLHTRVDSYGNLLNNVGYKLSGHEGTKLEILREAYATIAYENSYAHGYNTEKIIQPYSRGCFAIYKGGLDRASFNSRSMFYLEDYNSQEHMVQDIIDHYFSKELTYKKLSEPLFHDDRLPKYAQPVRILSWLETRINAKLNK